jgi:predicted nucleic acid-binding protein
MARRILDTSILVSFWRRQIKKRSLDSISSQEVEKWVEDLQKNYSSKIIVTPVKVEFLAGARTKRELDLFRLFIDNFQLLDDQQTARQDWEQTLQSAERIPDDGKPRQLGDCLIRALAKRYRYDVETSDTSFPK